MLNDVCVAFFGLELGGWRPLQGAAAAVVLLDVYGKT